MLLTSFRDVLQEKKGLVDCGLMSKQNYRCECRGRLEPGLIVPKRLWRLERATGSEHTVPTAERPLRKSALQGPVQEKLESNRNLTFNFENGAHILGARRTGVKIVNKRTRLPRHFLSLVFFGAEHPFVSAVAE